MIGDLKKEYSDCGGLGMKVEKDPLQIGDMRSGAKSDESDLSALLCTVCGGYNYVLLGCCGGQECGCMGMPVDSKPCGKCNPDGNKEPSLQAQKDWPWFFLTEKEWNRHQAEKAST